jgi:hypothetical protein
MCVLLVGVLVFVRCEVGGGRFGRYIRSTLEPDGLRGWTPRPGLQGISSTRLLSGNLSTCNLSTLLTSISSTRVQHGLTYHSFAE